MSLNNHDSEIVRVDNVEQLLKSDEPLENQNWVCVSIVSSLDKAQSNTSTESNPYMAIKVRGVFKTEEEAKERASYLQKNDPYFDIFIGKVGEWTLWKSDVGNEIKDVVYYKDEIQTIMNNHQNDINSNADDIQKRIEDAKQFSRDEKLNDKVSLAREEKLKRLTELYKKL